MDDRPTPTAEMRNAWLKLPDEELLRQCRVETMRGTGPGGQKRNKTESAVRLIHRPSGVMSRHDETRSQHMNKRRALDGLRLALALQLRFPRVEGAPLANGRRPGPLWVACVLDLLEGVNYGVADAAAASGMTTSRLCRELAKVPLAWEKVNAERAARGFPKLKCS